MTPPARAPTRSRATDEAARRVIDTVAAWPRVSTRPGRVGSTAGRAEPHQVGIVGWVTCFVGSPRDVDDAVALLRPNYDPDRTWR